ncbi:MAG: hypothetical protein RLZZ519_2238 [Bacteroidota bacterium]|jgi:hypothetical protein
MDLENGAARLSAVTNKEVTPFELGTYDSYQRIEDFIGILTFKPIENWEKIDDTLARDLIVEMYVMIESHVIQVRNGEALEKRFGKPAGFVHDLIFVQEMDVEDILKELKRDTVIRL